MGRNIVIDFEFCKVSKKQRSMAGTQLHQEIIEFGAVMLDDHMNVIERFRKFVKPQYGTVSPFISDLTGITSETLENQMYFPEVMAAFVHWIGDSDFQMASWSMNDYRQLSEEILDKCEEDYSYIFDAWRDIQKEYADRIGFDGVLSLKNAMSSIDENFEGKAHDALADAENTALLVALLADKKQFDDRTKNLQDLLKPAVNTGNTLGSMFGELFAEWGYALG